jgi:hypothetical protein
MQSAELFLKPLLELEKILYQSADLVAGRAVSKAGELFLWELKMGRLLSQKKMFLHLLHLLGHGEPEI